MTSGPCHASPRRRRQLPTRRPNLAIAIQHGPHALRLVCGFFATGRVGEVFADIGKPNSEIKALLDDACILVSKLLQQGIGAADLDGDMARDDDRKPQSLIGAILAAVAWVDAEVGPVLDATIIGLPDDPTFFSGLVAEGHTAVPRGPVADTPVHVALTIIQPAGAIAIDGVQALDQVLDGLVDVVIRDRRQVARSVIQFQAGVAKATRVVVTAVGDLP